MKHHLFLPYIFSNNINSYIILYRLITPIIFRSFYNFLTKYQPLYLLELWFAALTVTVFIYFSCSCFYLYIFKFNVEMIYLVYFLQMHDMFENIFMNFFCMGKGQNKVSLEFLICLNHG